MAAIKKIAKRVFGWAVVGAIAYFFWKSLSGHWHELEGIELNFGPQMLLATIAFAASVIFTGFQWKWLIQDVSSKRLPTADAVRAHLASWLLKYIPGQVGALVYKLKWGSDRQISKISTSFAFGYDVLFVTISSTLPVFPVIFVLYSFPVYLVVLSIVLGIAVLIFMTSARGEQLIRFLFTRITRLSFDNVQLLGMPKVLGYSAVSVIPRVLNGIGFVLVCYRMFPLDPSLMLTLCAGYILARIVGFYAIGVPSGLGVREGIIVGMLSLYMATPQAIAISLVARLYSTVADVLVALVYAVLTVYSRKLAQETETAELHN